MLEINFAAITQHKGWAMALTGASIVLTGLTVLSLIISQLHKILGFFEKKDKKTTPSATTGEKAPSAINETPGFDPLADLQKCAQLYQSMTSKLGESFGLAQLYKALDEASCPHPHITVRELKEAGFLAPADEGLFSWKNV